MTLAEKIRGAFADAHITANEFRRLKRPADSLSADEKLDRAAILAKVERWYRRKFRKYAHASGADRQRKAVSKASAVGDIPPVADPDRKERCRFDLEAFGWEYCRANLKHRASADIKAGLIADVQRCVLHGGKAVKMYGRGTGKSTWINDIASVWAALYGHRRYIVTIAANGKIAKKNLKRVKSIIARSDEILADFPAIAIPVRELAGITQRAASQTYRGEPTDVEWGGEQIKLPTLRGDGGEPLEPGCGAVIAAVGIGGAVRGANEGGQRPDFLILDDPQTKKVAHSPKLVADTIEYIHQDALFLAGHDRAMSAFVTITPQCYGDVATELTSQTKHPEWAVSIEPFVKSQCPGWPRLLAAYRDEYVADMAAHDYALTRSRAWYLAHRAEFEGAATIDPEQFDHELEVDSVHHVLNLYASLGEVAFNAEIMMKVDDLQGEMTVTPDMVANAVNGCPRGELPPGTKTLTAFCDINIKGGAGLSWAVVAFGPGRVAAVIDYGRWPERGPLCEENASQTTKARAVTAAMQYVAALIAERRYMRTASDGRRVRVTPEALGFDRGYLPREVMRAVKVMGKVGYYPGGARHGADGQPVSPVRLPFRVAAVRGYGSRGSGVSKRNRVRIGDHALWAHDDESNSDYLGEMAPYWREQMQSGFLNPPLSPGSLSLFGADPVKHYAFAQEVCAEKLVRKFVDASGQVAWDWATTGPEHWCDALTGCFALGSWFRCFDSAAKVVDAELIEPAPKTDGKTDGGNAPSVLPPSVLPPPSAPNNKKHFVMRRKRGRYVR